MARAARRRLRLTGDIVLLIVVIAAIVVTVILLNQVAHAAGAINDHARNIAQNTRGINGNTNAVSRLDRTNELAASIERSASPLDGQLGKTVNRANSINGKAKSIDGSASSINSSVDGITSSAQGIERHANGILDTAGGINSTAGSINDTSGHINSLAVAILGVSGRINGDVQQINRNLNGTITIIRNIRAGTQRLVAAGVLTRHEAACIDKEVNILHAAYNGGAACGSGTSGASE